MKPSLTFSIPITHVTGHIKDFFEGIANVPSNLVSGAHLIYSDYPQDKHTLILEIPNFPLWDFSCAGEDEKEEDYITSLRFKTTSESPDELMRCQVIYNFACSMKCELHHFLFCISPSNHGATIETGLLFVTIIPPDDSTFQCLMDISNRFN